MTSPTVVLSNSGFYGLAIMNKHTPLIFLGRRERTSYQPRRYRSRARLIEKLQDVEHRADRPLSDEQS